MRKTLFLLMIFSSCILLMLPTFAIFANSQMPGDATGDGKIGLDDVIYDLQIVSGMRVQELTITGRWEGTLVSDDPSGVFGVLLAQSGKAVTGTLAQYPLINGLFSEATLTGYFINNQGIVLDVQLHLSADGHSLEGPLVERSSQSLIATVKLIKVGNEPLYPSINPPQVISTIPASGQTNVSCSNLTISISWSRPVNGWDIKLSGIINGIFQTITGNDLIDSSKNAYNPITNTFTMVVKPILTPGTQYTIVLDSGSDVDWHDAYGVPAWYDIGHAYQFIFTTSP